VRVRVVAMAVGVGVAKGGHQRERIPRPLRSFSPPTLRLLDRRKEHSWR